MIGAIGAAAICITVTVRCAIIIVAIRRTILIVIAERRQRT